MAHISTREFLLSLGFPAAPNCARILLVVPLQAAVHALLPQQFYMPLKGPVPAPLKAPADSGENMRPVSARGSARGSGLARVSSAARGLSHSASFKRKGSRKDKDKSSLSDTPTGASKWFKSWKSNKKKPLVPPPLVAQLSASLLMSRRFDELSETVHASAAAAADKAHAMGLSEEVCVQFYSGVVEAAAKALDPIEGASSASAGANMKDESPSPEASSPNTRGAARIEGILAKAIKRSAVRVTDLFLECVPAAESELGSWTSQTPNALLLSVPRPILVLVSSTS